MDIEARFDEAEFLRMVSDFGEELLDDMEERFIELGDEAKAIAWGIPSPQEGGQGFRDVTGALRSSIGASVFREGLLVYDNYEERSGTSPEGKPINGGNRGVTAGRELSARLATEEEADLQMILTAAMPYAAELQMLRGRDVLASAVLHLEGADLEP